ncbi:hypothetical protein B0H13DRAFT_1934898 [Mycena leptocephala]|nr:hypothetical protein B0H13DRAFT_1934898 [Mycena leptocephala]
MGVGQAGHVVKAVMMYGDGSGCEEEAQRRGGEASATGAMHGQYCAKTQGKWLEMTSKIKAIHSTAARFKRRLWGRAGIAAVAFRDGGNTHTVVATDLIVTTTKSMRNTATQDCFLIVHSQRAKLLESPSLPPPEKYAS